MEGTELLTEHRLALALQAGQVGAWLWDGRSGEVEWDPAMEAIFGLDAGGFGGRFDDWVALTHPDDRDHVAAAVERAVAGEAEYRLEHRIVRPGGSVRWLECRGQVIEEAGEVVGMVGIAMDVTERRELQARQEQLQAERERARQRLAFLAQASDVLFRSLEIEGSLEELARLAVPRLADWAVVNLLESGHLRASTIVHADPGKVEQAKRLLEHYARPSEYASLKVLRTGQTEVLQGIDDALLEAIATDEEHLALLRGLGFGAAVIVPLKARDRMLGTLSLARSRDAEPFGDDDLTLANDLARRASVAIDNARLYDEQRRLASALQQTLLPPQLPTIPGIGLAAGYVPASSASEVGGDFYDAFENGDGSWTLLIGDVRGKGPAAASLTGLSRHTARAAALRDPDPVEVLAVLNDALISHDPYESFCTAVCARLQLVEDRVALAIAGGGHLPALVVRADGQMCELPSSGMLLGLFPDPGIEASRVVLGPGDALLLCTDGVTEARRGAEQYGFERLRGLLAEAAGGTASELTDRVLGDVADFQDRHHSDDIAVLAVRRDPSSEATG